MSRLSSVNRTLRWLDDQALSTQEHRAIRQLWANHVCWHSRLFRGCRTRGQVLAVLEDDAALLAEFCFGPRLLMHLRQVLTRAMLPAGQEALCR
jgi:hypothetical protein